MSEREESVVPHSLLTVGWIVVAFLLGMWVGHFGLQRFEKKTNSVVQTSLPGPTKRETTQLQKRRVPPRKNSTPKVAKGKHRRQPPSVRAKQVVKRAQPRALPLPRPVSPQAPTSRPVPKSIATSKPTSARALTATDLPGIAFERLEAAKRKMALSMMNRVKMPCGCGQTIAQCAKVSLECEPIQRVVEVLMESVHKGMSRDKVEEAVRDALQGNNAQQQQPSQDGPPAPKSGVVYGVGIAGAPAKGPKDAKLTVVLFSDFECPYCAQGSERFEAFAKKFGKKNVRLVYRHFPLPFHPKAAFAAEAAMAAHAQGKFWEYHDKLFANQQKMDKKDLIRYATEVKLDVKRFTQELNSRKYKSLVQQDLQFATQLNVPGTPFFFVNGMPIGENETLISVGEEALKKANALLKKGVKPEDVYATLIKGAPVKP